MKTNGFLLVQNIGVSFSKVMSLEKWVLGAVPVNELHGLPTTKVSRAMATAVDTSENH